VKITVQLRIPVDAVDNEDAVASVKRLLAFWLRKNNRDPRLVESIQEWLDTHAKIKVIKGWPVGA
jgi:hypothetical protein